MSPLSPHGSHTEWETRPGGVSARLAAAKDRWVIAALVVAFAVSLTPVLASLAASPAPVPAWVDAAPPFAHCAWPPYTEPLGGNGTMRSTCESHDPPFSGYEARQQAAAYRANQAHWAWLTARWQTEQREAEHAHITDRADAHAAARARVGNTAVVAIPLAMTWLVALVLVLRRREVAIEIATDGVRVDGEVIAVRHLAGVGIDGRRLVILRTDGPPLTTPSLIADDRALRSLAREIAAMVPSQTERFEEAVAESQIQTDSQRLRGLAAHRRRA